MKSHLLKLENISIGFGSNILLKDLNLTLNTGEMICLMGKNGSGKSTLLKSILKMIAPLTGRFLYSKKECEVISFSSLAQLISVVFSSHLDFENLKVEDIIKLGRTPYASTFGVLTSEDYRIVGETIKIFELSHLKNHFFHTLSDGQKQKVMIARAFAQDTPIVLLDEPTNFLDLPHQFEIMKILKMMSTKFNKTILYTSHNWELILKTTTSLWCIVDQNIYTGSPEDLILNNILPQCLGGQKLFFDKMKGHFYLKEKVKSFKITLYNDSHCEMRKQWTLHFLEKEGLEVEELQYLDSADLVILKDKWIYNQKEFGSLHDLFSMFR